MFRLTAPRAAVISLVAAVALYQGSLSHRWSPDDWGIIRDNQQVHSLSESWRSILQPYWPEDAVGAGLYRPLTKLTYGWDWWISDGRPGWFHAVNLLLHGLVSALVVLLVSRWLSPWGSLVAGLAFAAHPVHVEAVAQAVGRADLLAAVGMLGSVLMFRRYRMGAGTGRSRWWAIGTVIGVGIAMTSKEHGVVTLAVLALDHYLDRPSESSTGFRGAANVYLALFALSLGWLYVWQSVAGAEVGSGSAAALAGSWWDRIPFVLYAHLHVYRLLAWPTELSADYGPWTTPPQPDWGLPQTVSLLLTLASLAAAVVLRRRAPLITFAVLMGALSYLPTSNLLFASGTVLGERTLYLAVLAPAALLGWITVQNVRADVNRWLSPFALALVLGWSWLTVQRVPFWRSTVNVVTEDFAEHPENYRARVRWGFALEQSGKLWPALAEYTAAASLYPEDPFIAPRSVRVAMRLDRSDIAFRESRAALELEPTNPALIVLHTNVLAARGDTAQALRLLRRSLEHSWLEPSLSGAYVELLERERVVGWRLRAARGRWALSRGHLLEAEEHLRLSVGLLRGESPGEASCWDVSSLFRMARFLGKDRLMDELADPTQTRLPARCLER